MQACFCAWQGGAALGGALHSTHASHNALYAMVPMRVQYPWFANFHASSGRPKLEMSCHARYGLVRVWEAQGEERWMQHKV